MRASSGASVYKRGRSAGSSAGERFEELFQAWRRRLRRIWFVLFAIAGGIGLAGLLVDGQAKWYLAFIAGGVLGVTLALRDTPPHYIENWRQGQQGERWTAKRLRPLLADGWFVWHDLATRTRANIDHIALSQQGLFLLDSKNYLGVMTVEREVLRINWIEDSDDGWEAPKLIAAAKAASAELSERIAEAGVPKAWVQPVVVLWGRFDQRIVQQGGVWFVHGEELLHWLRGRPIDRDQARVELLVGALTTLESTPTDHQELTHQAPTRGDTRSRRRRAPGLRAKEALAPRDFLMVDARGYIGAVSWRFAKTMPKTPHEYTVRDWRPDLADSFQAFAALIRQSGIVKPWPRTAVAPRYRLHYLEIDGWEYWTMEGPLIEIDVINRARPS